MSEITYSVIGPGSSSDDRINVSIGCETNALICWVGRTRFQDSETCTDSYRDETYCSNVTVPGGYTEESGTIVNGQIEWKPEEDQTIQVYYTVNRVCPRPPSPSCTYRCEMTAYPAPAFVPKGYDGNIDIHYTYTRICESGEYVGNVESVSNVRTIPFTAFTDWKYTLNILECSATVTVGKKEEDDCEEGERADISISFNPKVVPSTGATVTVIVSFKRTVTDANCNKKITSGSFRFTWEVSCEGTEEEPYKCCEDHYVTTSITKTDIISNAKLGNDAKIYYDGKLVTEDEIQYKILMKAKITDECENYCQPNTTYGVIKDTVKVCYEDGFMTNKWIGDGCSEQECDCSALSIEGYNGSYAVPYTGGRIKVSWGYVAHTINNDCSDYFTEGVWEEIIPIGGCDERPTDCKYDLVFNDGTTCTKKKNEGDSGICEDDCKCDAECCYDYDGNGNCKCIIYFKEQFPEFYNTEDICTGDDKKSKLAVYKCTKCGAITTTKSDDCNPVPPKDKEGHKFCPSCHSTGDDVFGNPIAFDMSNGQPDGKNGLIYNKVTYEFVQDCTPVCGEYTKTITYEKQTKEYQACDDKTESFLIPYTATINYDNPQCEDTTAKGEELVTIKISPNESSSVNVIIDDDRLKLTQAAGPCHSECNCDALSLEGEDEPASDCDLKVTGVYSGPSYKCEYTGKTSQINVATFNILDGGCICSSIKASSIRPETSSCESNECSSFDILYDIEVYSLLGNQCVIKAKVKENYGGTGHNVKEDPTYGKYEKWHYRVADCEDCYFNFYQAVGDGPTPPSDNCDPENFDCFIEYFNARTSSSIKKISQTNTPNTYNALRLLYDEAYSQFYRGTSLDNNKLGVLYNVNNFKDLYDFYGSNDTENDRKQAFNALVGFMFGMLLTEANPGYTSSQTEAPTNKRGEFMRIGYEFGTNDKDVQLFGRYAFHSDPNVARLIGSAIYACLRSKESIGGKISDIRSEMGGSPFNSKTVIEYEAAGSGAWDNIILTRDELDSFFPKAPGPYASGIYPTYTAFPNDTKENDKNIAKDWEIYNNIVRDYNLNNPITSGRTVQAIADKEGCSNHFFGDPVTVGLYSFEPVFYDSDGVRIPQGNNICALAWAVGRIAEDSRWSSRTSGRMRPGSTLNDWVENCDSPESFLCNYTIEEGDGCPTHNQCLDQCNTVSHSFTSFPSGHSARGWAVTLMLLSLIIKKGSANSATLIPKIIREGYDYSVNRTISRYHWTSDIINGRIIGAITYPLLCSTKDYDSLINNCEWNP